MQTGGPTQNIAWGPVDFLGACAPCLSEVSDVAYGADAVTVTIADGQCMSSEICIWVADSSYTGGTAPYIPGGCAPTSADNCNVCGPYKVSVRCWPLFPECTHLCFCLGVCAHAVAI